MRYRNPSAETDTVSYPVLSSDFDVDTISGAYVVSSTSRAYGSALHAVDLGYAKIIGQAFVGSDEKMLLVTFGQPSMRRPNEEGEACYVTFGRDFFTKILSDYTHWKTMWWREVVQNSVDAGCTRMTFTRTNNGNGTVTISAEDNGSGMSEDTLKSALLTLGESTKTAVSGSAGGFGVAKQLILFPWISYEIHTRNVIARGQQANYTLTRNNPLLNGTKISVVMPIDGCTDLNYAADYISKCYLPAVRFSFIDGNTGENYFKPDYDTGKTFAPKANVNTEKMDLVAQGANYEIYFNKNKKSDCSSSQYVGFHVRIISTLHGKNAFEMFTDSLYAPSVNGNFIVEITGASTEIFVSSRTTFGGGKGWVIKQAMTDYINRLSVDKLSAVKPITGIKTEFFRNDNKFVVPVRPPTNVGKMLEKESASDKNYAITSDAADDIMRQYGEIHDILDGQGRSLSMIDNKESLLVLARSYIGSLQVLATEHLENALEQLNYRPDFVLYDHVLNFVVPPRFRPETMTTRVRRMLQVWTECVRWCLMQMNYANTKFAVGFCFDTSKEAMMMKENGENWVLINPFGGSRRGMDLLKSINNGYVRQSEVESELIDCMRQVTDRNDFENMYATAIHECTHFEFAEHDELFASAMTNNVAVCASGIRQYSNILKATKEGSRGNRN